MPSGDRGVFALWSDDPPEDRVLDHLLTAFTRAWTQTVKFDNPITGGTSSCTIYLATPPRRHFARRPEHSRT
jgi:hypothetical protein